MSSVRSEYFGGRLVIGTRSRSLWTDRMMQLVHNFWKLKGFFPDEKGWTSITALWSIMNTTSFEVITDGKEVNPALEDAKAFWEWLNISVVISRRDDGTITKITEEEAILEEFYQRLSIDVSTHVQDVWWTAFEKAQADYSSKKDATNPANLTAVEKQDPN